VVDWERLEGFFSFGMDEERQTGLKHCWACGIPFESVKAGVRCCGRPGCRAALTEIDSLMMLQCILANMKIAGGGGWAVSMEEELREAVSELGESEERLGDFLIWVLEGRPCLAPVMYPGWGEVG
jgi:hypothetical protein